MKNASSSSLPTAGLAAAVGAYLLWGTLPIYWKLLSAVPAMEVLAHRILWSCVFLFALLLAKQSMSLFRRELKELMARPRQSLALFAASLLISSNWLVYIWAVQNGRIVESSLGYYINPLVSIVLGMIFLHERLTTAQAIACLLALGGVLQMAWHFGSIPWISLFLAVSFGLYGLCKKLLRVGSISGIALETLVVAPLALLYLGQLIQQDRCAFVAGETTTALLCIGTGAITATPLILFASGVKQLPLKVIGFIQYLSPTLSLLLGIFLYHEPFQTAHFISFSLIWSALLVASIGENHALQRVIRHFRNKIA